MRPLIKLGFGFVFIMGNVSAFALSPTVFLKNNPVPREQLVISPKSFTKIKTLKDGTLGMDFLGEQKGSREVWFNKKQVSNKKKKRIETTFNLSPKKTLHEIKVIQDNGSEYSYYFRIKPLRELPPTLRIRLRSDSGRIIQGVKSQGAEISADEWVSLSWISESEALSPEKFELRQVERQTKNLQTQIEKEQEELLKIKAEKLAFEASLRKPATTTEAYQVTHESFFQVSQGLGFFSLQQPQTTVVESWNWLVNFKYQKISSQGWLVGLMGQGFLVPLSSSKASASPRFIQSGVEVGRVLSLGESVKLIPKLGFDYQSLITNAAAGYRNLMGPRLEVGGEYSVDRDSWLKASLFINLFDSTFQGLQPLSYQWGGRLEYQWKSDFLNFKTFIAGAEFSHLKLQLADSGLTSSLVNSYLGVRF
jgi:hypothetical protein